jgi:hypothetical protein
MNIYNVILWTYVLNLQNLRGGLVSAVLDYCSGQRPSGGRALLSTTANCTSSQSEGTTPKQPGGNRAPPHSYQVKDQISNIASRIRGIPPCGRMSNIQVEESRTISLKMVLLEGLSAEGGFTRPWRVDLCVNRVLSDESDSAERYIALRRTEQPGCRIKIKPLPSKIFL